MAVQGEAETDAEGDFLHGGAESSSGDCVGQRVKELRLASRCSGAAKGRS